jgi:hypothetical protein
MNVTNDKNVITLAHEVPSHGKKTQHHPPAGPNMPQPTQQIPPKSTIIKTDKPRPHICLTCTRSFARLEHLKRHERSHTKEKPFQCPVCERCFARRDLLLRHKQKLHASFPETPKVRATAKRKSVSAKAGSKAVAAAVASGAPQTATKQTTLPPNPAPVTTNTNNGVNNHASNRAPSDISSSISPATNGNPNDFVSIPFNFFCIFSLSLLQQTFSSHCRILLSGPTPPHLQFMLLTLFSLNLVMRFPFLMQAAALPTPP